MKIIAHRGASFYAPENTMSAFKLAMQSKADGFEVDVHMTKDKKIVAIHDESTGRTGTKNFKLSNTKFSTLQKVDVGSWFGEKFKGEKIPLLEYIIESTPEDFDIYIEIKSDMKIVNIFYEFIQKYSVMKKRFFIMSFNYDLVYELKRLLPDFQILWIVEFGQNIPLSKDMYKVVFDKLKNANLDGISTAGDLTHCLKMAKGIRENNWIFNVWTVDNPHLAKRFLNIGVTSLTTNRPDWIIQHLKLQK